MLYYSAKKHVNVNSTDIDECNDGQALCSNGGSCVNLEGSYRCDCIKGWTGKTCNEGITYLYQY